MNYSRICNIPKYGKFFKIVKQYAKFNYLKYIKKVSDDDLIEWTKQELISSGTTFIKLGQLISTRNDLFGDKISESFKQLQVDVLPLPYSDLETYVEPYEESFIDITKSPLSSASISQIHRVKLDSGENIVVKIKRPGLEETIDDDFDNLLFFISILKKFSENRVITEFEILFKEYYKLLKDEVNFKLELNNIKKFGKNYSKTSFIKIPKPHEKFSDDNIISMEYVPSIRIDDMKTLKKYGYNPETISQKLFEVFVKQILQHGLVHIDLHPGNIGITKYGKLVMYDFGMVIQLDKNIKDQFTKLMLAVYNKDVEKISEISMEMGLIMMEPEDENYYKLFLIYFLDYVDNSSLEDFKLSYVSKINKNKTPFVISSKFILLMRGVTIIEGICKKLDPGFNFRKTFDSYISEYLTDINYFEYKAKSDLKMMNQLTDNSNYNSVHIDIIERDIKTMENNIKKEKTGKFILFGCLLLSTHLSGFLDNDKILAILSIFYFFF